MRSPDRADWRRARHAWGDVLADAASVVGEARSLSLLLAPLSDVSAAVGAGRPFDWKAAELSLQCVRYEAAALGHAQGGSAFACMRSACALCLPVL